MDVVWFFIGVLMVVWWVVSRVRRAWRDRRIVREMNERLRRSMPPRPPRDSTKDWMP